jgi:hypothetical protein
MDKTKKILLGLTIFGISVGGFVFTYWAVKNLKKVKGFIIIKKTYNEKPEYSDF